MIRNFKLIAIGILFLLAVGVLTAAPLLVRADDPPTPTAEPVDHRFGAIESFWAPAEAAELGVGWERILFYWNEIQPKDADDWNTLHVLEEWLVEAAAQDRTVIGLLKNTPAWATDGDPFGGVPRGLYLPVEDPDNLWANYVRRVVNYYAPLGVHNWIIWNEPEIKKGVYGHEFEGTIEDYVRLLQVAYLVAKEHDPQATIHLAGYSYWHDPAFLPELFEVLTADPAAEKNDYYFDALSLHIYFRVETVAELVQQVDELQNEFGLDKPIWVNETNAAPNLDPWWPVERPTFPVDLDQQAWYIVQAHALGFGAGADSMGVYKLIDILLPEGGESFGILRPDYSQRPAYLAYRTTIAQLRDFTAPATTQALDDAFIVTFNWPDKVTRVIWSRRDRAVTLAVPALAESAVLVDHLGNEQPLALEEGRYKIELDGARCRGACDIGGPPIFLVEEGVALDGELPQFSSRLGYATLTPMPDPTLTFTPWPILTATATATATATHTPPPTATPSPTMTATPTATATETPEATVASVPPTTAPPLAAATAGGPTTWWLWGAALILLLGGTAFIWFRSRQS